MILAIFEGQDSFKTSFIWNHALNIKGKFKYRAEFWQTVLYCVVRVIAISQFRRAKVRKVQDYDAKRRYYLSYSHIVILQGVAWIIQRSLLPAQQNLLLFIVLAGEYLFFLYVQVHSFLYEVTKSYTAWLIFARQWRKNWLS